LIESGDLSCDGVFSLSGSICASIFCIDNFSDFL